MSVVFVYTQYDAYGRTSLRNKQRSCRCRALHDHRFGQNQRRARQLNMRLGAYLIACFRLPKVLPPPPNAI